MTDQTRIAPADYSWEAALAEDARCLERLLAAARELSDDAVRERSKLPGWTRGHLLTHIARNADALRNLLAWAATGVETPMYPDHATRDADIEAGAGRPAAELADDIEAADHRLRAAFAQFPPEALERAVRTGSGAVLYGWEIPYLRIREVEIHHADLDVGYTPAHWAPEFAIRTLDQLVDFFRTQREMPVAALHGTSTDRVWHVGTTGPTLSGQESALLAWLTGRSDGDGLISDRAGPIPLSPGWV